MSDAPEEPAGAEAAPADDAAEAAEVPAEARDAEAAPSIAAAEDGEAAEPPAEPPAQPVDDGETAPAEPVSDAPEEPADASEAPADDASEAAEDPADAAEAETPPAAAEDSEAAEPPAQAVDDGETAPEPVSAAPEEPPADASEAPADDASEAAEDPADAAEAETPPAAAEDSEAAEPPAQAVDDGETAPAEPVSAAPEEPPADASEAPADDASEAADDTAEAESPSASVADSEAAELPAQAGDDAAAVQEEPASADPAETAEVEVSPKTEAAEAAEVSAPVAASGDTKDVPEAAEAASTPITDKKVDQPSLVKQDCPVGDNAQLDRELGADSLCKVVESDPDAVIPDSEAGEDDAAERSDGPAKSPAPPIGSDPETETTAPTTGVAAEESPAVKTGPDQAAPVSIPTDKKDGKLGAEVSAAEGAHERSLALESVETSRDTPEQQTGAEPIAEAAEPDVSGETLPSDPVSQTGEKESAESPTVSDAQQEARPVEQVGQSVAVDPLADTSADDELESLRAARTAADAASDAAPKEDPDAGSDDGESAEAETRSEVTVAIVESVAAIEQETEEDTNGEKPSERVALLVTDEEDSLQPEPVAKQTPSIGLDVEAPTFDIVRVDQTGLSTVAGRAAPRSKVRIVVDGTVAQEMTADRRGQFASVFSVDPTESPIEIALEMEVSPGQAIASEQVVVVLLQGSQPMGTGQIEAGEQLPAAKPAVTAETMQPVPPTVLLVSEGGIKFMQPALPVIDEETLVETVSYDETGEVVLSGRTASLDGTVRILIDGVFTKDAKIRDDKYWSANLEEVMPGRYRIRVEEVSSDGRVVSSVEMPFQKEGGDFVKAMFEASRRSAGAELGVDTTPATQLITVQRGYTLWGISRKRYGLGRLYVNIYDLNRDQIDDPDLIFPGQIFKFPLSEDLLYDPEYDRMYMPSRDD